ncbi:LTA synthase family protein [Saccharicrinis sp. FJH62]|uniref:LTA synthase family protein n=1 Tax=Saccharicrinis sp. FJH62 TaxID=3344657 RepID=UPI0035D4C2E3
MNTYLFKRFRISGFFVLLYRFVILLFLYAICRVLFYLFNTDMFQNVTLAGFGKMMLGGLKFDISAIFYLNSIWFILAIIPFPWLYSLGYRQFLKWLFVIINAFGLALNVIDFEYYPFILKRTTFSIIGSFKYEVNLSKLAGRFIIDYWFVFVVWIILIFLLVFLYNRVERKPISFKRKWMAYPAGFFWLLLYVAIAVIGMRGGWRHSTRPITLSNAGDYVSSPEEVAIVLNTPFSIIRTCGKETYTQKNYFTSDEQMIAYFNPVYPANDSLKLCGKNVMIIILESFSREHFGCFNDSLEGEPYKGYTPFLDSLAGESLVFPNAFANGRKSIDALPSVVSGLPALVLPFVLSEYSSDEVSSMAGLLSREGYNTTFWHGAPNGSMGFSAFTKMVGFEHYMGKKEFNDDRYFDGIWGIWDEQFLQFIADNTGKDNIPFLNVFFSLSSHHPYKVPQKYEGVFPVGDMPLHKCVGYTDNALRLFFKRISKEPWFKNTLFVITADHSTTPVHREYKTNVNAFAIPLIFYTPDGSLKGVDERLAQQTDIMPSVLHYLHYPGCYVAFGDNLFDKQSKTYVLNFIGDNYQYMEGDLVIYFNGKNVTSVFNYKSDPFLKHNIISTVDITRQEQKLKAVIQQYSNRIISNNLICR